jgi:hypothetical protein
MARRDGSVPGGERRHHVREARSAEPPLPRLDFSSNRVRHDPNAYNVFRTRRRTPDLCRLRSADPSWQDRAIAHRSDQQWNLTPRDELHRVDWRSGRSAYRQQRPRDDRNGGIRRHGQGSARDGDWCRPQRTADAVSRQQDARITMVRSRGRKCPMQVSDASVRYKCPSAPRQPFGLCSCKTAGIFASSLHRRGRGSRGRRRERRCRVPAHVVKVHERSCR